MELKYGCWKVEFLQNEDQVFHFKNARIETEALLQRVFFTCVIFTYVKIDEISL